MGGQGKVSRYDNLDSEKEDKYFDRKVVGFWANEKGIIKTIVTICKGIKVGTIMERITRGLHIETWVVKEIVTLSGKRIIRI